MDRITIGSIEMPRTRQVRVGGEFLCKETTMASGKIVKDAIGWKATVEASWEYVPADTMTALCSLVKQGNVVEMSYPSPTGDESGLFEITIGSQKIFKFVNGSPMWQDVTLKAVAQEVE